MKKTILTFAALSLLAAGPAFAAGFSGTCTNEPKEKWMSEADAEAKLKEAGYTVSSIKTTRAGNCYEAYAKDNSGKKVELFVDPATGTIVHTQ